MTKFQLPRSKEGVRVSLGADQYRGYLVDVTPEAIIFELDDGRIIEIPTRN